MNPSSLNAYKTLVRSIPRMTEHEERKLLKAWRRTRDVQAAYAVVHANLRHVVAIANNYASYRMPFEELVSEGNLGLIRALEKFDERYEVRFITYAGYWIRAYIIRYILRNWSMVRSSSGLMNSRNFFALRREHSRALALAGSKDDATGLISERLGLTLDQTENLISQIGQYDVMLDAPLGEGSDETLLDRMVTTGAAQESKVVEDDWKSKLRKACDPVLRNLTPRERIIFDRRIMAGDSPIPLAEIGRRLGISRERVRQLEFRMMARLKRAVQASDMAPELMEVWAGQ